MKAIRMIEYKEEYLEEIKALLSKDINYMPEVANSKHSLLLRENKDIIGIGSIWGNTVHPYREYISIYIDPDKRANGFGKILFHELESRYQLERLQTAFDSNNSSSLAFARKCGFQLARKSYCYNVTREMLKPLNYTMSGEIISCGDLSENQLNSLIATQYEDYKLNHQGVNPLSEDISPEGWGKYILDDLVIEDSYILIKDNDIYAYLLSYGIDEKSIAVGYTGNRCNNIKEYEGFLYETVKLLFKSYKRIELEIDDCDKSANILGQLFAYKPDISWDAYIKDNIGSWGDMN